jgi:FkbM family methyltransferase
MAVPLTLIERLRRRWHPLHQIRRVSAFRSLVRTLDRPIWTKLYGVSHPVRIHLLKNSSYLVNRRSPEPAMTALLLAILDTRKVSVFWDIGANIGYFSWLITSASPTTRVLAVEPDRENYAVLRQSQIHAPAVQALNVAVSRVDGSATFLVDSVTGATGTLESEAESYNRRHFGETSRSIVVPTRSLDSLGAEYGVPDLIKIDVEGHESSVIDGAAHLLTGLPLILIEAFDPASRALQTLREAGYRVISADTLADGPSHDVNYLAIPEEQSSYLPNLRQAHGRVRHRLGLIADIQVADGR